jgi:hypothetical protein
MVVISSLPLIINRINANKCNFILLSLRLCVSLQTIWVITPFRSENK